MTGQCNKVRKTMVLLFMQLFVMSVAAQRDYTLHYTVGLDTVAHYLHVRLDYQAEETAGRELVLNMPVWTPGYYEILNFRISTSIMSSASGPLSCGPSTTTARPSPRCSG